MGWFSRWTGPPATRALRRSDDGRLVPDDRSVRECLDDLQEPQPPASPVALHWVASGLDPWQRRDLARLLALLEAEKAPRAVTLVAPEHARHWSAVFDRVLERDGSSGVALGGAPVAEVWFHGTRLPGSARSVLVEVPVRLRSYGESSPTDDLRSNDVWLPKRLPESTSSKASVLPLPYSPVAHDTSAESADEVWFVDALFANQLAIPAEARPNGVRELWQKAAVSRTVTPVWVASADAPSIGDAENSGFRVDTLEPGVEVGGRWQRVTSVVLRSQPRIDPTVFLADAIGAGVEVLAPAEVRSQLPWELRGACRVWSDVPDLDLARLVDDVDSRDSERVRRVAVENLHDRVVRTLRELDREESASPPRRTLVKRAKARFTEGEWTAAVSDLCLLADAEPRVATHCARLGRAYVELGAPELGFRAYAEAIHLDPTDDKIRSKFHQLGQRLGHTVSDDEDELLERIAARPDDARVRVSYAELLGARGSKTRALGVLREARERVDLSSDAGRSIVESQCDLHWERGDDVEVEPICEEVLANDRRHYKAAVRSVIVACRLGRDAAEVVRRASRAKPIVSTGLLRRPDPTSSRAQLERWIDRLLEHDARRAAFDADPTDPVARFRFGQWLQAAHRFDEAVDLYESARSIDPNIVERAVPLAADVPFPEFLIIGAPRSGTSWLKIALARHPGLVIPNGEPNYFLGRAHLGVEEYLAQFDFETALFKTHGVIGDRSRRTNFFVGEKSPQYGALPLPLVRLLKFFLPDVRLQLTVRDPVSRGWSHIKHAGLMGDAEDFFEGRITSPGPKLGMVLHAGEYDAHIRRWAQEFDLDQLLINDFSDIKERPQDFLDQISTHFGVEPFELSAERLENRRSRGATAPIPMPDTVREGLERYYADTIFDAASLRALVTETRANARSS